MNREEIIEERMYFSRQLEKENREHDILIGRIEWKRYYYFWLLGCF